MRAIVTGSRDHGNKTEVQHALAMVLADLRSGEHMRVVHGAREAGIEVREIPEGLL